MQRTKTGGGEKADPLGTAGPGAQRAVPAFSFCLTHPDLEPGSAKGH